MSKIVQAVNAMIVNPKLITQVLQNDSEFFFLYRDKYKWSISSREDGEYRLFYYPGDDTLERLSGYEGYEWEDVPLVSYSDSEIGTKEAKASFAELYTLVKEQLYKVDDVLDDIISDADRL